MGTLGTLAAVGGTTIQALGQARQGDIAKSIADANAKLAQAEGQRRQQAGKEEAFNLSRERQQLIGRQALLYGAAGVDLSGGSPLDVMANTAAQYERDISFAGLKADQAMQLGEQESELQRYQGRQARAAGWLGAGSTLLTGFGNLAYVRRYGRSGAETAYALRGR
jgi:hypothetical protein